VGVNLPNTLSEEPKPISKGLEHSLLTGVSALGAALATERGAGFLGNVLAARIASPQVFGAYALGLTTAMNVAIYAGAGIGSTASRFVGQYPLGSSGYPKFIRALATVCITSALLATVLLFVLSDTLAVRFLGNAALTPVLRVSSLFAGAFILLECYRGLLIGQRSTRLLMTLSAAVGIGLVAAVPLAARYGAEAMVTGQSAAIIGALLLLLVLQMRAPARAPQAEYESSASPTPSSLSLWRFGLVQLSGVIGLNAAGWWVASFVTASDHSMLQMAMYSISSQLRNIVTLVPGLVAQSGFALMTEESSIEYGGTSRVLDVSTTFANSLAVAVGGAAVAVLPWVLRLLYGARYEGADLPASLAIVTALIHTSAAPSATRLVVLSLRATAIINSLWALLVITASTWLVPARGAAAATAVLLAAHLFSMVLVLIVLRCKGQIGDAVTPISGITIITSVALASAAWARSLGLISATAALAMCICLSGAALLLIARHARRQAIVAPLADLPAVRFFSEWVRRPSERLP
jgi:O-antigen/teichoic acid export membrane protein